MRKVKSILLAASCSVIQLAAAQTPISLEECLQWARSNSPQYSQLSLLDADLQIGHKILSRDWLPTSSINGKATWQSEVIALPLELPGIDIQSPPQDQYQLSLDIRQNIWDGGLTNAQKKQSSSNIQVEKMQLESELYRLNRQVAELYFGALLAERLQTNGQLLSDNIRQRMAQAEAAIANGTAIKTSLSVLEVRLLEAEQQILEAGAQRNAALAGLAVLTGKDISATATLATPQLTQMPSETVQRPELDVIAARQELILSTKSLIDAREAPKLGAFAQAGYGQPGLNFLDQGFNPFLVVGAQLSVPLSHLYSKKPKLEQEQLSVRSNILSRQKDQFLLQNQLQQTNEQKEIDRLRELIETDRRIIELRENIRMVAAEQLDNGIITSSDYLDDLNKEDLARQQLILHEVRLSQAIFNWNHLVGKKPE